ncbi:TIGR03084 family metal-binding protein [Kocuria sp. M1R5S2]|uniref:TIGR03084 family metal-binding protein n=1 Tax=Kocuria rhizosphaerae TaxID=3376285 RepID=UPI0037A7090F
MTRPDLATLLADLRAEGELLEELLRPLPLADWDAPTPSDGWAIRHQVAHLAWTDQAVLSATEDPGSFAALRERFARDPDVVDRAAQEGAARPSAEILESWCHSRSRVLEALAAVPDGGRIPWIGTPLGAAMMASARIMETWAHGQDVRDALGLPSSDSPRLRHIAHLAVAARDYAFQQRHLPPPAEPFRVALTSGSGDVWTWGPPDAAQRVRGSGLDFALLATRRRHRQDCAVTAEGPDADAWLDIVQAYAGPPGLGREPRSEAG